MSPLQKRRAAVASGGEGHQKNDNRNVSAERDVVKRSTAPIAARLLARLFGTSAPRHFAIWLVRRRVKLTVRFLGTGGYEVLSELCSEFDESERRAWGDKS